MYWAPFLHIYQPPTQKEEILRRVAEECYRPLVSILKENKDAKITLNINACLTEQLIRYGYPDIIDGLGQLAQEKKVEFTESAKYHPILPLIPKGEMERQIELNHADNTFYFRDVYRPEGFFSPEMCYNREVAQVVQAMGFKWILADEIAYNGKLGECPKDRLYSVASLPPLKVFFKERRVSLAMTFGKCKTKNEFKKLANDIWAKEAYLLTGTDGEIYGHHYPGQERLLIEIFGDLKIKICTISELNNWFTSVQSVEPAASSWSSWADEIETGIAYPQWNYPENGIHQLQWELARLVIDSVNQSKNEFGDSKDWQRARQFLDEGLHSCQWWWASCRPWWDTQMVDRGINILTQAIIMLRACGINKPLIDEAYKLRRDLLDQILDWQSTGRADMLQKEYLKSHPEVSGLLTFGRKGG